MPEIKDGEEGVEKGRKGEGEVEEGTRKEGDEKEMKEGAEEGKERWEETMAEVHHEFSGVDTSGEMTRRMKAPPL